MTKGDDYPRGHEELYQLGFLDKLRVLRDDERAGFLPSTYIENTMAVSFLDYVDSEDYHAGIANQLQEVFLHQFKHVGAGNVLQGRIAGQRAVRSVAYEMADFLFDATKSVDALTSLNDEIRDCPNPNVAVAEEIGAEHPGYAPLVRYYDLSELRQTGGNEEINFDPLHPVENEKIYPEPDRRKVIEDQYTGELSLGIVKAWIAEFVGAVDIGVVRKMVIEAKVDQEKRTLFWADRLRETNRHGAAWPIGKAALEAMHLPIR
jgi:hypothetical protein